MDSKPRLKWTSQLHQLFVDAVSQLGGVDSKLESSCPLDRRAISCDSLLSAIAEATPKYVMRVMGVPGLTLHHLKSHLQVLT